MTVRVSITLPVGIDTFTITTSEFKVSAAEFCKHNLYVATIVHITIIFKITVSCILKVNFCCYHSCIRGDKERMHFVIKRPMQNEWKRKNCFNTRWFCLLNGFKPYESFSCKRRKRYNFLGNALNFDLYWALITIEQIESSSLPRSFLTPFSWQVKCHLIDWLFSILAISEIFQQYRILCPSLSSSYVYIFFSLMRTWPAYPLFL